MSEINLDELLILCRRTKATDEAAENLFKKISAVLQKVLPQEYQRFDLENCKVGDHRVYWSAGQLYVDSYFSPDPFFKRGDYKYYLLDVLTAFFETLKKLLKKINEENQKKSRIIKIMRTILENEEILSMLVEDKLMEVKNYENNNTP